MPLEASTSFKIGSSSVCRHTPETSTMEPEAISNQPFYFCRSPMAANIVHGLKSSCKSYVFGDLNQLPSPKIIPIRHSSKESSKVTNPNRIS
ncbi:hypothetical protein Nepgr_011854 [Nepenthes gracilis]|uniref:Uncharacterized protein n=1 Tax=Nepenthes gracilis TaxID=150966 RepID=A0AAD3SF12_NEPGR|nr:hypothetical protein Nepgr_011854 [Nepenthes gracilis]